MTPKDLHIDIGDEGWSIATWPDLKQPTLTRRDGNNHEIMARFKSQKAADDFKDFLERIARAEE